MDNNYYIKRKIPERMIRHAKVAVRNQDWDEASYIIGRIKKIQYIHIGGSSAGWKFKFQYLHFLGPRESMTKKVMIGFIKRMVKKGNIIVDENYNEISFEEMVKIINNHQNGKSHNINPNYNFVSEDGCDFGIGEFS